MGTISSTNLGVDISIPTNIRTVVITAEALLAFLQMDGKKLYKITGLPKDAQVVNVRVHQNARFIYLDIVSAEFELHRIEGIDTYFDLNLDIQYFVEAEGIDKFSERNM